MRPRTLTLLAFLIACEQPRQLEAVPVPSGPEIDPTCAIACPSALCGRQGTHEEYCTVPCDPNDIGFCQVNTYRSEFATICAINAVKADNPYGPACWTADQVCPTGCPEGRGFCYDVNKCIIDCEEIPVGYLEPPPCPAGMVCAIRLADPRFNTRKWCWPRDLIAAEQGLDDSIGADGAPGGDPTPGGDP